MNIHNIMPNQLLPHLDNLIKLLKNAVDDGASIGFMAPLDEAEAQAYWQSRIVELEQGKQILLAAIEDDKLVGVVQLALEPRANGNHRAEVQKLMVHTDFRQRGIGRKLMIAAEEAARSAQRTLLVLDTRRGDPAEQLYGQMGYIKAGIIPQYARSSNGRLDDTVFFYKKLPS